MHLALVRCNHGTGFAGREGVHRVRYTKYSARVRCQRHEKASKKSGGYFDPGKRDFASRVYVFTGGPTNSSSATTGARVPRSAGTTLAVIIFITEDFVCYRAPTAFYFF